MDPRSCCFKSFGERRGGEIVGPHSVCVGSVLNVSVKEGRGNRRCHTFCFKHVLKVSVKEGRENRRSHTFCCKSFGGGGAATVIN